jgi:hypothetical protein
MTKPIDTSIAISLGLSFGLAWLIAIFCSLFSILCAYIFTDLIFTAEDIGHSVVALFMATLYWIGGIFGSLFCLDRWDLRKDALIISPHGIRESVEYRGFVPWRAVRNISLDFHEERGRFIIFDILPDFKDKLKTNSTFGDKVVLTVYDGYGIDYWELLRICKAYHQEARHTFEEEREAAPSG